MRLLLATTLLGAIAVAQGPWRNELMGLSDHPAGASAQDIDRFVQNVQLATPYFATLAPGDFEANREMVRRMYAYVMALEMMAGKNPAVRPLARRARNAMNGFPIAYTMIQPGGAAPKPQHEAPPPKPGAAPFIMTAPAGTPEELTTRYESTAASASTVWKNAETLRLSLESRGMSMNATTAASLGRLQSAMDSAQRSMQAHKWDEANESLDRANGEIEKIGKVVGR